jgi:lysyl-tRNA synthetase class 2
MWQPTATIDVLKKRAAIFAQIRQFFAERDVLEVDTPLMSHATVTDPYIISIPASYQAIGSGEGQSVYLQTSPECAMKRLLAAGSGSIYQISKAFRQGEVGRLHNPEFTMLEWYRLGFDHHQLMDEMDVLLQRITQTALAERITYGAVFENYIDVNPHLASIEQLRAAAKKQGICYEGDDQTLTDVCFQEQLPASGFLCDSSSQNVCLEQVTDCVIESDNKTERNMWLDLLFSHCIEPYLGHDRPCFIYDFPVSQAALAKIRAENPPVASRFEVYFKGIELANGFHELQDAEEQRRRFKADQQNRERNNITAVPLDENFLAALKYGLPECAGVALGVDRLILLTLNADKIDDVLSFAFERA